MPQSIEEQTLAKIDQILRILAVAATRDMKQRDQIALLDQAGMQPKDIAEFLGTSPNTVSVRLSALRKGKRSNGKRTSGNS